MAQQATETKHVHYIPAEHGDFEFLLLQGDLVVEKLNTPRDMCAYCFADNLLIRRPEIDTVAAITGRRKQ